MRGILLYILIFLCLSVAGCRGGRSYDSRLVAADSLVASQPDSALRLLRGVGFDSVCSDADRAYFALLLTQAKYKCYETINSTDTIDIAVDYFADGSDAEKRLRSLIYRGAALTDMGEITAAMEAYKQAEAAASPDDYENLGYINLRMASLYQKVYSDGREYIDKYRKALHYYELSGNNHYQIVCTSRLGAVYRPEKMDSAYYFINKSIELAKSENDSTWLFSNYELLAHAYWRDSLYQKQKETALYVFNEGGEYATNECLYDLCLAYSLMNKLDSAEYYNKFIENINGPADSVKYLIALTNIAVAKFDYKNAYLYEKICNKLSDSITMSQTGATIAKIEANFEIKQAQLIQEIEKKNNIIITVISVALVIFLIIIIINLVIRHKNAIINLQELITDLNLENTTAIQTIEDNKKVILQYKNRIIENEADINNSSDAIKSVINAFESQVSKIKQIVLITEQFPLAKPEALKAKIDKVFAKKDINEINFLTEYVNLLHNNAINRLRNDFPNLNDDDITIIVLQYCNFSISFIALYMNYSSRKSVVNRRLRIASKMGIDIPLLDFLKNY